MICHCCGGEMENLITDQPFKLSQSTIVIVRDLPVIQCDHCGEYMLADEVMQRVERVMNSVDRAAELEIVRV